MCWDMIKFIKNYLTLTLSIITIIFTFVPETIFQNHILFSNFSEEANVVVNRVLTFIAVFILSMILKASYLFFRRSIHIKGNNYSIKIKYGDLFTMCDCKKIIPYKIKICKF